MRIQGLWTKYTTRFHFDVSLNQILLIEVHDYTVKRPSDNPSFIARPLYGSPDCLWYYQCYNYLCRAPDITVVEMILKVFSLARCWTEIRTFRHPDNKQECRKYALIHKQNIFHLKIIWKFSQNLLSSCCTNQFSKNLYLLKFTIHCKVKISE